MIKEEEEPENEAEEESAGDEGRPGGRQPRRSPRRMRPIPESPGPEERSPRPVEPAIIIEAPVASDTQLMSSKEATLELGSVDRASHADSAQLDGSESLRAR